MDEAFSKKLNVAQTVQQQSFSFHDNYTRPSTSHHGQQFNMHAHASTQ
jgi:hypothetical protein